MEAVKSISNGGFTINCLPSELKREGMQLIIRVQCRICDRWLIIPDSRWLSRPRSCCDECDEVDNPIRVDADGWPL